MSDIHVLLKEGTYTGGKKSQHEERLALHKRNLVGMFVHLRDDIDSNFALCAYVRR